MCGSYLRFDSFTQSVINPITNRMLYYLRMPVTLAEDLYKWLVLMKCMPNDGKSIGGGKVQLSAGSAVQLESGSIVGKLIKSIIRNQKESSPSSLDHLKDGPTPSAKANNWAIIWNCFPLLRMEFDPQIKDLIIAGDNEMISEVVNQLWEKYPANVSKVQVPGVRARDDKNKLATAQSKFNQASQQQPQKNSDAVDITKLDQKKDPTTADSSLEFLLLLLCQSLNLPANQVLGLFTNQNKYLAHVIAKGIKGDFTPIINFYESLKAHVPKIKSLFESDPKSEGFTLYALKPGLVSKSPEVVLLTIELFKEFDMYDWFVGQGKCLWTFILGVKRHPQLRQAFTELLISVTQNNFQEFITKTYKTQFQNVEQLMSVTAELLKPFSESKIRDELDKSGVVFDWISTAMQNIEGEEKDNLATRLACIQFLNKLWVSMPEYIEDDEETYNRLLLSMKKDWLNKPLGEFVSVMVEMFNLLVSLANQKNPAAKLIYNLVSIVLSQTIKSEDHREFLLLNLTYICKQFPNIPLSYLLQNYTSVPSMQVFDFQFLSNMASSQNLDVKSATIIGQIATRFFQGNVINACCSSLILKVVSRFHKDMVDFVGKTVKSLLSILYATEKNKKTNIQKPQPMYNGRKGVQSSKAPSNAELQMEIVSAQQRALIVELIKKLIMQNHDQINQKVKAYIIATSLQIKQFNKQGYKGINGLLSLYGNQKQIEEGHITEARQRRASESSRVINNEQSSLLKESVRPKINTKVTATQSVLKHLSVLHESVIEKQKKIQKEAEVKQLQEQKKKAMVKKQMEKVRFMKGFGGQGQLFEDGYWQRKMERKPEGLEVIELELLEPRDLEFIQIILKRYHKVMRQIFLKYTTTGFTTKNATSFDQAAQRTETISNTELVKLLKDSKLFFLTELQQCQLLVRDVNVKILKKRQTQQFDFSGFEQFIVQFALVIFSRPHTVNIKTDGKIISEKRELKNMMPAQILETFFKYLRTVTEERGESTVLFDDPDSAYFNESEVIKEFNRKLQQDPNYILPEGYKKVTDRTMVFEPKLKTKSICQGIKPSYVDCSEILDQILFNGVGIHTLQLVSTKITKSKARPNVFVNVGSKLLQKTQKIPAASRNSEKASIQNANKMRELISSAGDVKYHGQKLLQKKNLSLGMKLGLSHIPYKYKLLGEQVAYILDDMLSAVEAGRTTIQKPKIINEAMKNKQKLDEQEKKAEQARKKKLLQRKKELQKLKQELVQKKEKDLSKEKEEKQKKRKEQQKQRKRRQEMEKYFSDQKSKLQAKKKLEQQENKKKQSQDKEKKKHKVEQAKKKFEDFNQKQIDQLTAEFKSKAQESQDRKKKEQVDAKFKEQKIKRIKNKIKQEDSKINQQKQKMNEQLAELFNSPAVQEVFRKHELVLRALFDFLLKSTFLSLTQRKHNNEVIFQTWSFFNLAFRLSPVILDPKEVAIVFQTLTKMKQQTKEYYIGLDYPQFLQALLREAVKHKTIFNKFSQKIIDGRLSNADVSAVLKAEDKNQFEQQKQVDLNELLKEQPVNSKLIDNYGDISKANENTIRGLIYYLKLPEDKNMLEHRFRQVLEQKNKRSKTKKQQLKQKLNDDYSVLKKSPMIKIKKSKVNLSKDQPKEEAKEVQPESNEQPVGQS